jgi:hypothetical protein
MNYKGDKIYMNMVGGSLSGVISLSVTYPTEYVKTKMQIGKETSFTKIFKNNIKKEGILGMYKGYLPVLASIIPRAGINYSMYEYIYYNLRKKGYDGWHINLLSGMCSGGIAGLIMATPVENIKTYRICEGTNIPIKTIYEREGIKVFYKGMIPTIIKESTTYGTRFLFYTSMYKKLEEKNINFVLNSIISSTTAGFMSSYLNNPLDVIQTRKQMPNNNKKADTIKTIIKNEGWQSLYKGSFVRSLRTIPAAGISFLTYEILCKNIFKM